MPAHSRTDLCCVRWSAGALCFLSVIILSGRRCSCHWLAVAEHCPSSLCCSSPSFRAVLPAQSPAGDPRPLGRRHAALFHSPLLDHRRTAADHRHHLWLCFSHQAIIRLLIDVEFCRQWRSRPSHRLPLSKSLRLFSSSASNQASCDVHRRTRSPPFFSFSIDSLCRSAADRHADHHRQLPGMPSTESSARWTSAVWITSQYDSSPAARRWLSDQPLDDIESVSLCAALAEDNIHPADRRINLYPFFTAARIIHAVMQWIRSCIRTGQ